MVDSQLPHGLPKLRSEAALADGALFVSANRLWRRLMPSHWDEAQALMETGDETVAVVDASLDLAEDEARHRDRDLPLDRELRERRRSRGAGRHQPTLADLTPNERLPSIRAAFEIVVERCGGRVDVVDDRLRIEVTPATNSFLGPLWRPAVKVLAHAERYVVQQLLAGNQLADVQVSATGWPVAD